MEHSRFAHRADFGVHGAAAAGLAVALLGWAPPAQTPALLGWLGSGLAGWTLLEYGLHRFVLHRVQPFRHWHEEHHRRPMALIGTPTAVTVVLIGALVFAPTWWLADLWRACSLTLGLLMGYLAYSYTHHAVHHRALRPATQPAWVRAGWGWHDRWLRPRRRWHARHHQHGRPPGGDRPETDRLGARPLQGDRPDRDRTGGGCYGVSSRFWDRVFGSTEPVDRLVG